MTPAEHIARIRGWDPRWHGLDEVSKNALALCDAYEALAAENEMLEAERDGAQNAYEALAAAARETRHIHRFTDRKMLPCALCALWDGDIE